METSQHQKWVNLSYLALAMVVGYVFFAVATKLIGTYDLESRLGIHHIELFAQGVSVVVAGIVMFSLWKNDQANQFMNEVMVELSRVTWPTQRETYVSTMIVIIMVIISGAILGALDSLWTYLLKMVLR